jgi:hypothetical protein
MHQHFYTYPTVVELPGQRVDPRAPLFAVAHPRMVPDHAGAPVQPAAPASPAR